MKKPKICVHCDARFKNRTSLRFHLIYFHEINLGRSAQKLLTRGLHQLRPKPHKEHKQLRRVRMAMCQARRKKERNLVSRKAINRGKGIADRVVHRRPEPFRNRTSHQFKHRLRTAS